MLSRDIMLRHVCEYIAIASLGRSLFHVVNGDGKVVTNRF